MNNVHDDAPVVFQTRWALSYLRGPLSREQIETLMQEKKDAQPAPAAAASKPAAAVARPAPVTKAAVDNQRPVVPTAIEELFLPICRDADGDQRLVYRPAVFGLANLHFAKSTFDIDTWETVAMLSTVRGDVPDDLWEEADELNAGELDFETEPEDGASFAELPSELAQAKLYKSQKTALKNHLYRSEALTLYDCKTLKLKSQAGETEGDFRVRLKEAAHERRDLELEKLRKKYAPKLKSLDERIRKAEQKLEKEQAQVKSQTLDTALSVGSTVLGALFGRKMGSRTNVSRATSSMRSASRIARERGDVADAQENIEALQEKLVELEEEFTAESDELAEKFSPDALELKEVPLRPRKSDLTVDKVALVWTPWIVDTSGIAEPAFGE